METIIKIELPMKRIEPPKKGQFGYDFSPWWRRLLNAIYCHYRCSIQEFGGRRVNTTHTFILFRWPLVRVNRNEYHDQSDAERAEEYLRKWSECEKELRGLRLLQMGDAYPDPELRKLLKDGLGVDLDEGQIL